MERILRLSRDVTAINRTVADPTGGHGLSVAVDPAVEWPIRWYLRDFPDLHVVSTQALASGAITTPNPPQLIFRPGKPEPTAGYTPQTYKLSWSYPAGQPLNGNNALLTTLGFIVFRNNVPPAASVDLTVEYSADLAQRLFVPPAPQGPFNLDERPGPGKAPGQFDAPRGVAIGPDGAVYVVDMRNARIEQYTREGVFVRQFGGLGHGDGQLWRESSRGPTGLAVGPDGYLYVADTWNYRIQKFTLDGKFVAKWGTFANLVAGPPGGDRTGLYGPRGIAFGPNGDVYVTDTGNGRVVVYGTDGTFRREFASKGQAAGQLDEPVGIAVSADGSRVYVADSNNARIAVFDGQGKPVAQWDVDDWRGKSYYEPYLVLDKDGTLYATSSATRQVLKFNTNGQVTGRISGGASAADAFVAPFGIAIAPDGTIYVSDGGKSFVTTLAAGR
jgi:DNA-binding beta-propeller fold protein YncE